MAALSAVALITQLYASVVAGLGRMDVANYVDSAGRIIGLLASVTLVWRGWSLDGLAVGTALYYGFSQLAMAIALRRLGGSGVLSLRAANWKSVRRLSAIGLGMFASSLLAMLLHPFNRFVMARWCGVSSVPVYEIAYSAAMQLRALAETGFRAMAPEISNLASKGRAGMARVRAMVRRGEALSVALGLPVWMAVSAVAPAAMKLWLGSRFDVEIPPSFRVVQVGTFLSLLCVPSYYALLGLGRSGKVFVANIIQSLVNMATVGTWMVMEWRVDSRAVSTAVTVGMGMAAAYVVLSARRAMAVAMAESARGG
jgi:O-antigen/teichoic acid export membrane protein